ncbi:MAG: RluA family pseudouridine synthase [Myxococcota bacterium]
MDDPEHLDADADRVIRLTAPMDAGRLDRWLAGELEQSRSQLQSWIKAGDVTVDGQAVRVSHRLEGGERVVVRMPPPPPTTLVAQDIPIEVLYEDAHLMVVVKPSGLVMHPAKGHPDGTLVNALLHRIQDGGGAPERPGIVHRLDKGTSGTLVVARDAQTHTGLSEQFAARTVHRRYLALCWGRLALDQRTVDAPLGRHPTDRIKFAVVEDGKRAITHVVRHQTARPQRTGAGGEVSLVTCRLETGRTHQIRVHMEHIGHPLVGDPLYGAGRKRPSAWRPLLVGLDHPLLHASELGFTHPVTGAEMRFHQPLPDDFQQMLNLLGIETPPVS